MGAPQDGLEIETYVEDHTSDYDVFDNNQFIAMNPVEKGQYRIVIEINQPANDVDDWKEVWRGVCYDGNGDPHTSLNCPTNSWGNNFCQSVYGVYSVLTTEDDFDEIEGDIIITNSYLLRIQNCLFYGPCRSESRDY